MPSPKVIKLLVDFKKRFFYNYGKEKIPYGIQRICKVDRPPKMKMGAVGYDRNDSGTITDQLLFQHFNQELVYSRYYDYGSVAVLADKWPVVKWICFDADSEKQIEDTWTKLLPALTQYGITYLVENSREGRMHIWVMTDLTVQTAERFCSQLYIEQSMNRKEWEIYPLFERRNAIIRMPGGWHIKNKGVGSVLWNGEEGRSAEFILTAFNSLPIYTEEFIKSKLKEDVVASTPLRERKQYKPFVYLPRKMPLPMEGMPKYLNVMASECQAIRKLIFDMINEDGIQERGIPYHNSLLALSGISYYIDKAFNTDEGRKWWEESMSKYRDRDAIEHMVNPWEQNKSHHVGVWRCETYDRYFGFCEGCPFRKRDGFETPKQLYYGKKIERVKVEDVD